MSQFVYVMADEKTHLLKIGISVDPEFRATQVSKEFGCDAVVLGVLRVEDALKTERFIHGMLANTRVVGEWFEVESRQREYLLAYFSEKPVKVKSVRVIKPVLPPVETTSFERDRGQGGMSNVRQAVKAVMKEKGLTQEQVADSLGVNRVYVNRMLSGGTSNTPGRWEQLLDHLGLELTVKEKS